MYSYHTNISGNIIKHNLRTLMNERRHFFMKIYLSHFILERVDISAVFEGWLETYTKREDFFFPYLLPARQRRLWSAVCPSLNRDSLYCLNLTVWLSSRGLLPVRHLLYPSALIALLLTNQNVTACGVSRKESKIHVIFYIT